MEQTQLLDEQSAALFEQMQKRQPSVGNFTEKAQIQMEREGYKRIIPMAGETEQVFKIEYITITSGEAGIPLKVYYPNGNTNLPILIYFHGGGFVAGGFDTHEQQLRYLVNHGGVIVVAVDYRLSPEHKYPAAINDGVESLKWIISHVDELNGDMNRIAVGGDSAGGTIAAVVTLKARAANFKILFQLLLCPITDLTLSTSSWQELGKKGLVLNLEKQKVYYDWYLPKGADRTDACISPLFATNFEALPPTFIISASADPLKDEAALYALRLKQAGVAVEHIEYEGVMHGFYQQAGVLDKGRIALNDAADRIKKIMK